jgi:hypothetical protein
LGFIIAIATVAALGISFGAIDASAAGHGAAMEVVAMAAVITEAVAGVVARDCSAARS